MRLIFHPKNLLTVQGVVHTCHYSSVHCCIFFNLWGDSKWLTVIGPCHIQSWIWLVILKLLIYKKKYNSVQPSSDLPPNLRTCGRELVSVQIIKVNQVAPRPIQLSTLRAGMVLEYTSFSCVILLHRIKCSGAVLKLSGKLLWYPGCHKIIWAFDIPILQGSRRKILVSTSDYLIEYLKQDS